MEMVRLCEFCLCFLFCLTNQSINATTLQNKFLQSLTDTSRSVIACFYYLEFAKQIFEGKDKFEIYKNLQTEISNHLTNLAINPKEITLFERLHKSEIYKLEEDEIQSSGYVLHTLEASIWCLLTTDNYRSRIEAVKFR